MAIYTTDYSFREVTAKPRTTLKVGDTIKHDTVFDNGQAELVSLPAGAVVIDPDGKAIVRDDGKSSVYTYYSHNAGNYKFKLGGTYTVAYLPVKPVVADPVADLAVELGKARFGAGTVEGDIKWIRTDKQWLEMAKWVQQNFIPTGTHIIVDNDREPWYPVADGKWSLTRGAASGRTRDYILREYGIKAEVTVR